jgi:hypothetical protein
MRKFRFIGDPSEWDGDLEKDKIYAETFSPKGWNYNIVEGALNYPDDWEEVFDEPKKLHKDTDLGYFAGVALRGLLANSKNYDSTVNFSIAAIETAKELIQQLDQEQ